jgi:hypothetical protein
MYVIKTYRCYACKKIVTNVDIIRIGCCPFCNNNRVEGATATFFEEVNLRIRLLFMGGLNENEKSQIADGN